MAQELTANFGANSTKFSKGVQEIKAQLTEINKALELNKQAVADTNKKAKEYEKELNQLKTAEKENGQLQKNRKPGWQSLKRRLTRHAPEPHNLKPSRSI